jgi:hypothetical protein
VTVLVDKVHLIKATTVVKETVVLQAQQAEAVEREPLVRQRILRELFQVLEVRD